MVSDPFLKRRRLPTGLAYDNQVRSSGTLVRPQPIERIQCAIVTLPWLDRADHQDGWTGPHVIECLGDALASSNGRNGAHDVATQMKATDFDALVS